MLFKNWRKNKFPKLDKLPESICVMPWVHFHVTQDGLATPCCQSPWNKEDALGDVNNQSIEEIWNSAAYKDLRIRMLQGKIDSRCVRCFEKEKNGWMSLREISNNDYLEKIDLLKLTNNNGSVKTGPRYFDIRFSNACNLKCRICGPWASSQWHSDAISVGMKDASVPAITNSIASTELFFDDFEKYVNGLEQVYFAGGEPLFMQEHYDVLDLLLRRQKTDVKLTYNTNLSRLRFKKINVLDYWSKFSHVNIAASIDAMGLRGEYLRKNMKWSETLENIEKTLSLSTQVEFMISPTVYIMNVYNLPSFHRNMVEEHHLNVEDFIPTLLVDPSYYNIQILPAQDKKKISELYLEHLTWIGNQKPKNKKKYAHCIQQFENIITYLFAQDKSDLLPQFIEKTAELDELRDENFISVFPELSHLREK